MMHADRIIESVETSRQETGFAMGRDHIIYTRESSRKEISEEVVVAEGLAGIKLNRRWGIGYWEYMEGGILEGGSIRGGERRYAELSRRRCRIGQYRTREQEKNG